VEFIDNYVSGYPSFIRIAIRYGPESKILFLPGIHTASPLVK
jgi:hypothetical protein